MVTMSKIIDAGEIPVRRISSSGVRPYIVDLEWARQQRVTKEPSIGFREAAKEVGISIDTLDEHASDDVRRMLDLIPPVVRASLVEIPRGAGEYYSEFHYNLS